MSRRPSPGSTGAASGFGAAEQERADAAAARAGWRANQLKRNTAHLVFIDETWATTNMARHYGRAPRGQLRSRTSRTICSYARSSTISSSASKPTSSSPSWPIASTPLCAHGSGRWPPASPPARGVVAGLGGRWYGGDGMARCPAHDDRDPPTGMADGQDRYPCRVVQALDHRWLCSAQADFAPAVTSRFAIPFI
jgi:hypothetical protein